MQTDILFQSRSAFLGLLAVCGYLMIHGCGRTRDLNRFGEDLPPITIVTTIPRNGAQNVSQTSQIDLCFSSEIDPRSFVPSDITLNSGQEYVGIVAFIQLFPWFAPGERLKPSEERWCAGSVISLVPQEPLAENTLYRVSLRANIVGWEGESFASINDVIQEEDEKISFFVFEFTTSAHPTSEQIDTPAPVTLSHLFESGQILSVDSPACSCHQQPATVAYDLLNLSTPEQAFVALHQRGELESTGFPMVSPGNPSESYLIQKLITNRDHQPLWGVRGDVMPPGGELTHSNRVAIARWIADGALF